MPADPRKARELAPMALPRLTISTRPRVRRRAWIFLPSPCPASRPTAHGDTVLECAGQLSAEEFVRAEYLKAVGAQCLQSRGYYLLEVTRHHGGRWVVLVESLS